MTLPPSLSQPPRYIPPAPSDPNMAETGQTVRSYRIAAGILVTGIVMEYTFVAITGSGVAATSGCLLPVIDVVLALGLYGGSSKARMGTLIRAVVSMVGSPLLLLPTTSVAAIISRSIPYAAFGTGLILLLTGRSQPWREGVALGLVVTLFILFSLLLAWLGLPF